MLVDKPLTPEEILKDENERERVRFLLSTINALVKENQHGSVTISVNGDWGSGKTTYLKVIESYYRDFCQFPVVFYEIWRYRDDKNPLIPLIMEIRDIPDINPAMKRRLSKILKPILASGIVLSDIFLNAVTGGKGIKNVEEALQLIEKKQLPFISKYRENLKLLSDTIKEIKDNYTASKERLKYKDKWNNINNKPDQGLPKPNDKKLFVLIIDDLDRLLPKEAFKIIETLRFYFDIDDVLIIMGINDEILNEYIVGLYGIRDKKGSERFLEKIFHWNYELSYAELNSLHLRSLRAEVIKDKEEDIERIKSILLSLDPLPHRKWIKIINRIENGVIFEGKDYRNMLKGLIFSALMKELYPELELFSRRLPHVLENLYIYKGEGEDEIIKEALKKIEEDKSYLDFPKRSYDRIKDAIKPTEV